MSSTQQSDDYDRAIIEYFCDTLGEWSNVGSEISPIGAIRLGQKPGPCSMGTYLTLADDNGDVLAPECGVCLLRTRPFLSVML